MDRVASSCRGAPPRNRHRRRDRRLGEPLDDRACASTLPPARTRTAASPGSSPASSSRIWRPASCSRSAPGRPSARRAPHPGDEARQLIELTAGGLIIPSRSCSGSSGRRVARHVTSNAETGSTAPRCCSERASRGRRVSDRVPYFAVIAAVVELRAADPGTQIVLLAIFNVCFVAAAARHPRPARLRRRAGPAIVEARALERGPSARDARAGARLVDRGRPDRDRRRTDSINDHT